MRNFQGIILLVDKRDSRFAFNLYNTLTAAGNKSFLILAKSLIGLDGKAYPIRDLSYYQKFLKKDYTDIALDAERLFYSLGEKKMRGGMSVKEFCMYKGVSLWCLSSQHLCSQILPVLHDFKMAEAVLDSEEPAEIHVIRNASGMEKVFESICVKRRIDFYAHKKAGRWSLPAEKFFRKAVIFARRAKKFLISLKFSASNAAKSLKLKKRYEVIFFAPPEKRFFLSMLPVALRYDTDKMMVINAFLSECSGVMKKNNIFYMDFFGYKLYSLFGLRYCRLLKKIRRAVDENTFFYSDVSYKETDIGGIINDIMRKIVCEVFPDNIYRIDVIREIISRYRPKVSVIVNSSPDIALTSRSLSVPVVAMQNGFVTELCRLGPLTANAVTVYGSYWKKYLLERQDFNPDKVYVTGSSKLDIMLKNGTDIERSLRFLDFSQPKKTVVFAGTYTDLDIETKIEEKIEHIRNVCKAMRNIKEARLIVKLHPCETDSALYKDMANELGLKDFHVVKDIDMQDLLRICDLVITSFSTVGYEAVVLGKNVISLISNYSYPDDVWHFKEYGAVVVADNLEKLEDCVRDMLFNQKTMADLKMNRDRYILEHAHKVDGESSGRIKEVIDLFV